jgi:tRNA threonylcarbamoyladenosine biosynthesis protein TsaB
MSPVSGDLLLCLDTSTPTARVAVVDATGEVRSASEATAARHSSHVLALVATVLERAGVRPAGLAGIACGGGPGSFTGLRVGLAVAKGLALPTGVPLYVVSSLEALARDLVATLGAGVTAVPCLDAGKGEVYLAAYAAHAAGSTVALRELRPCTRVASSAVAAWAAELPGAALAGNGAERYKTLLTATHVVEVAGPSAASVGELALTLRAQGQASDLDRVIPFYGRPPDITVKPL